jgi:hypothetical protein
MVGRAAVVGSVAALQHSVVKGFRVNVKGRLAAGVGEMAMVDAGSQGQAHLLLGRIASSAQQYCKAEKVAGTT